MSIEAADQVTNTVISSVIAQQYAYDFLFSFREITSMCLPVFDKHNIIFSFRYSKYLSTVTDFFLFMYIWVGALVVGDPV